MDDHVANVDDAAVVVRQPSQTELDEGVLFGVLGPQGAGKTILQSAIFNTVVNADLSGMQVRVDRSFDGNIVFRHIEQNLRHHGRPPVGTGDCHYIRYKISLGDASCPLYFMDFRGGNLDELWQVSDQQLARNPDVRRLHEFIGQCSALVFIINSQHLPRSPNNPDNLPPFPRIYYELIDDAAQMGIPSFLVFTQWIRDFCDVEQLDFVADFRRRMAGVPHGVEKVLCYEQDPHTGKVKLQDHAKGIWSADAKDMFAKLIKESAPRVMDRIRWIAAEKEREALERAAHKEREVLERAAHLENEREKKSRSMVAAAAVFISAVVAAIFAVVVYSGFQGRAEAEDSTSTLRAFTAQVESGSPVSHSAGTMEDLAKARGRAKEDYPDLIAALRGAGLAVERAIRVRLEGKDDKAADQVGLAALRSYCTTLVDCTVDNRAVDARLSLLAEIERLPQTAPLARLNGVDTLPGMVPPVLKTKLDKVRSDTQNEIAQAWRQRIVSLSRLDGQLGVIGTLIAEARELKGANAYWAATVLTSQLVESLVVMGENPAIGNFLGRLGLQGNTKLELAQILPLVRAKAQGDDGAQLQEAARTLDDALKDGAIGRAPAVAHLVTQLFEGVGSAEGARLVAVARDTYRRTSPFSVGGVRPDNYVSSLEKIEESTRRYGVNLRQVHELASKAPLHMIEVEMIAAAASTGWARRRVVDDFSDMRSLLAGGYDPSSKLAQLAAALAATKPRSNPYLQQSIGLFNEFERQVNHVAGTLRGRDSGRSINVLHNFIQTNCARFEASEPRACRQ